MIESRQTAEFKRKLAEYRAGLLDSLGNGLGVDDFGAYKQIVGRLQGLADAAKLADDTDYELNGGR